jgi:hypothetical protein
MTQMQPPPRPRSGIFPEPGAATAALLLAVSLALSACSRDARAVRLQALQADEELYRITCGAAIEVCREEAREVCHGDYEVLESVGAAVEPERVTTAPGPRMVGPRYQRTGWLGHMVVSCGTRTVPGSSLTRPAAPPSLPERPVPPALQQNPDLLCVPGATQECLGPGACRGAQACLMDGRGYGACDCGSGAGAGAAGISRTGRGADAGVHPPP